MKTKKVVFSGMQPTGIPHLGNYIGAMKEWLGFQESYFPLYCIVDMHAITIRQDPIKLRKQCRDLLLLYMATGLDPEKNILFFQSHVPAHAELAWILNCYTYMGELNRMTQFKEKSLSHPENINAGLFTYPALMVADVLLYQTDLVPVGEDQTQHIELTRDVARRFNQIYGDVFTIPKGLQPEIGARIMALQDPNSKMSKSDENIHSTVMLLDEANVARNKIKRAVTDSETDIYYDKEEKPGISNLLDIYASLTNQSIVDCERYFKPENYGFLKEAVAHEVVELLEDIQGKIKVFEENKDYVDKLLAINTEKANHLAQKTLQKVKRSIGYAKPLS